VNISNLSVQLRKLSQQRTQAQHDGDQEEVERLDDLILEIQDDIDAMELDSVDEVRYSKGR